MKTELENSRAIIKRDILMAKARTKETRRALDAAKHLLNGAQEAHDSAMAALHALQALLVGADEACSARGEEGPRLLKANAYSTEVGLRLKRARSEMGVSLQELAERSGVDSTTIAHIEGGGDGTLTALEKICAVLQLRAGDVLSSAMRACRGEVRCD